MQTQRSILNISMPRAMEKQIRDIADEENRTISELIREAFRVYKRKYEFDRDWKKIRAVGKETARRMGIKSLEDIERIAG